MFGIIERIILTILLEYTPYYNAIVNKIVCIANGIVYGTFFTYKVYEKSAIYKLNSFYLKEYIKNLLMIKKIVQYIINKYTIILHVLCDMLCLAIESSNGTTNICSRDILKMKWEGHMKNINRFGKLSNLHIKKYCKKKTNQKIIIKYLGVGSIKTIKNDIYNRYIGINKKSNHRIKISINRINSKILCLSYNDLCTQELSIDSIVKIKKAIIKIRRIITHLEYKSDMIDSIIKYYN